MKIVFLDAKTIGEDLDLSGYEQLGEVVKYGFSTKEQAAERTKDADVIILNKVPVNEETIGGAEHLKLVCVTATGTDNLDKDYLEKRGIAWRNVAGYSTETVAQHTFALLFYLMEHLPYYDTYVKSGKYMDDVLFTHFEKAFHELNGKTWGIIGLGAIGRKVAQIAEAFGCHILCYSASGSKYNTTYEQVGLDELLSRSDIVSVHAPLNAYTENLMTLENFRKMKKTAIFLNLARGAIVNEADLYTALTEGSIGAAGLDVLCKEPMDSENPLLKIQDSNKLIITPHIAWAAKETRFRVVDEVVKNIQRFQNGDATNRVY